MSSPRSGHSVLGSVAAGILVDRVAGEPPVSVHPVAWFGRGMAGLERVMWRDSRLAGIAYTAVGVGTAWGVGVALRRLVGPLPSTVLATAVAVAGRMLDDEALAVARLLGAGDLPGGRARLQSLVGRDASSLSEPEIAAAVVESVAENTTDAVLAPALWAAVAGAPGVLAHRAANTLDAMVGHRSDRYARFGWASARLDDVVNAVPAVAGVVLVLARHPSRRWAVGRAVVIDSRGHPSPNAGLIEGAFAGALDVQLGGVNRYGDAVEDRGRLGDGPVPVAADIVRAVRLRRFLGSAAAGLLVAADVGLRVRRGAGRGGGPTRGWRRGAT